MELAWNSFFFLHYSVIFAGIAWKAEAIVYEREMLGRVVSQ